MLEILDHLDADIFLCAPGSQAYLEESKAFESSKISIDYFHYTHPTYKQIHSQEFIPNMCVLDALFNAGGTIQNLIKS